MLIAKGVIAHFALPVALAAIGGGLLANAQARYDTARSETHQALHLDWQPESLAPRSSGEIACWQVSDRSIREGQVAEDYQGNIYVQDQHSGHLRVLKFESGFRLNAEGSGDWMSEKLADSARPAGSLH